MSTLPRQSGVHPILYAYYTADGRLDRAALERQVDVCLAAGCQGIAVLGLVTEVFRLSTAERLDIVEWAAARIAGRVPLMATVAEVSVHGQLDFIAEAKVRGADWAVLQPPPVKGVAEAEILRFLGEVADRAVLPVGIQNNPLNMEVSVSSAALLALHRRHPNIRLMKAEGPAVSVADFAQEAAKTCDVFAGHGGIEWPTALRSGCQGLIPAPELIDAQVAVFRLWQAGETERAEALHRAVLPVIVFMSRSLPLLLAYGKRLMALRMGLEAVHPRLPEPAVTAFGMAEIARFAALLGPLSVRPAPLSPALRRLAHLD
ncbi:dihydrodipicolinate synthase family protein [Falsiroseomonas selenitidurans]|uniref:Dihydrodipicolinate synthase family protein n=1 Tax=Falsiroseomonas selenitidurans TaxID=2716335 RepID=A0ABX1E1D8_9PROT|nr:dihydrodipicolinate synthase family protein [Falsiroseomonas selenitidurans]NKC30583.1 dihydrodipicolinate synthase family protein [Falsiroseomonas selenitidurans]